MSAAQRLGFLAIAVLIAVVAAILLIGDEDAGDPESTGAPATATPSATATAGPEEAFEPQPTATPQPPLIRSGRVTRLRFEEGDTIRFRVRSDAAEEIHVHGYDVTEAVPAGETVDVSFPADITGIFEIELHGTGEQIAQLRVDPG